jgi:hypothetical protein
MSTEIDYTKQAALSMDSLKDFGSSVRDTFADGKIPASLLAGGAAGLLAGGMTATGKRKPDESRLGRLARILGSAALVGGGVGAGVHLLGDAYNSAENLLPKDDLSTPEKLTSEYGTNVARTALTGVTAAELYRRGWNREEANFRGLLDEGSQSLTRDVDALQKQLINRYKTPELVRSHDALEASFLDPNSRHSLLKTFTAEQARPHLNSAGIFPRETGTRLDNIQQAIIDKLPGGNKYGDKVVRGGSSFLARHFNRLAGTNAMGRAGRLSLLAAAAASPEIAKALMSSISAKNNPDIYN